MKVRHKPPALVSMWMLDVFCCALGCVTLLFLLNSRMATDAVQANRTALLDLASADKKLAAALTSLDETRLKLTSEVSDREKLAASVTELEGIRLKLTDESKSLAELLKLARKEKDDTARKLTLARDEAKQAQARLDATQLALNTAEKKADITAKELAAVLDQLADATDLLKKKQSDIDVLAKKESTSAKEVESLQKLLRLKDDERLSLENRVAAMRKELTDVEARLLATQKELDANLAATKTATKTAAEDLAAAKAAAKTLADELANAKASAAKVGEELAAMKAGTTKNGEALATANAQIKDLTRKIDDANAIIIDLQGDKAKLADKFNKIQKETESRFAGIAMTGKKVVFLVDMSGSMGKRDLNNLDSTKWPMAVETVCKVMRSIPTLEEYQVIVFSSSATWLFGNGEWQTFSGEKSVERVRETLLKEKPKEDTNMFAGFEKAFSLRSTGLDTIYLFSDGLPTSGEGLTTAQQNASPPLTEQQLGVILGKHVRDTLTNTWNPSGTGKTRVKINSVGFYFESPDVGAFLWSLSRENDGSFVGMSKP